MTVLQQRLAALLQETFASDQKYHLKQQADGRYTKVAGSLSKNVIEKSLGSQGSLGAYQKNLDNTINWICLDFDVQIPKTFLTTSDCSSHIVSWDGASPGQLTLSQI
ncbi:hypothetical protein [Paraburkholderia unamae]|uniref:Uncharacterized protein n=1 Tax=Paraburkholderia unamae TaxID=219649 RepID=A0ACC6RMK4_9BURK